MFILWWIIVGLIAGWITGKLMKGSGFGFIMDMVVGLVGALIGMAARSRVVATGLGAHGAANAIYYHFLARGRDVVYPKDMAMVIGLGTRDSKPNASSAPAAGDQGQE